MVDRALPSSFYDRPVLDVAPELLGCVIAHHSVRIRLTEVEAYDGQRDPGSHAYHGRTPRTAVMFGPPGGLYVYFTYGMHFCANVVCGPDGTASAVLLRAGEVVAGVDEARARRTRPGGRPPTARDLARGPARLAQALGLNREHNGADVTGTGPIVVTRPGPLENVEHPETPAQSGVGVAPGRVRTGPRVGVSGAGGDGEAFPWRFWIEGEPTVSAYRPAVRRDRRPKPITDPSCS